MNHFFGNTSPYKYGTVVVGRLVCQSLGARLRYVHTLRDSHLTHPSEAPPARYDAWLI